VGNIGAGQDESYAASSADQSAGRAVDSSVGGRQSKIFTLGQEVIPTPDEAWTTRSSHKFETYARRTVQFIVLIQCGDQMVPQLDMLRKADITLILEKCVALTINVNWVTCFIPPALLEVACRRERGQALAERAEAEFLVFETMLENERSQMACATQGTVSYSAMRSLPITIIAPYSSCVYVEEDDG
jgi:hypothetical protein